MGYTPKQLEGLWTAYSNLQQRRDVLVQQCVTRPFKTDKSREYACQGLSRRLRILTHCIERVFARLPPHMKEPPDRQDILDATIYLQAFVFNLFGSIDDLAHIWVNERNVTDDGGGPLPNRCVGLRKGDKIVRKSLSPEFTTYLTSLEPWLQHLDNKRHALAHRIPLYIPPYRIPPDKLKEYDAIELLIDEARRRGDHVEVRRLEKEQRTLTKFEPDATHSFIEKAPAEFFHFQIICDYNTVEELAEKLLAELDRAPW